MNYYNYLKGRDERVESLYMYIKNTYMPEDDYFYRSKEYYKNDLGDYVHLYIASKSFNQIWNIYIFEDYVRLFIENSFFGDEDIEEYIKNIESYLIYTKRKEIVNELL